MHVTPRLALLSLAAVSIVAAGACKKKPQPAPVPVVNQDSINAENARRDSIARADQARRDSLAREQARADSIARARQQMDEMMANARNTITAPVYFEFDRSELSSDDIAKLDAKIPLLNANPELRIRVAGHTDSRGSDEYNMALGQRRAASAKRYLTQHGIPTARIETVSFGEEHPAAQGTDEASMAQNRRSEFEIIAGGDNITVPQGE
ncbi:MAG: OmpA family protein [Gemmatimonadaceae bacterium]|nr:OmpA family protein [Gemmatimonadaceae bacterium]NUQ94244.1 OmpA family protein [Gemmatimonadaceae bacterium]NUR21241.1 OmpA family protein [Gemmatimonadaceae bacterium]NUS97383.1 OmpA family protein [Gemmatimonadaceae bacterium]